MSTMTGRSDNEFETTTQVRHRKITVRTIEGIKREEIDRRRRNGVDLIAVVTVAAAVKVIILDARSTGSVTRRSDGERRTIGRARNANQIQVAAKRFGEVLSQARRSR